jgi:cyclopropane fatty-acyl-phospholipid synthase-like methyltransferase
MRLWCTGWEVEDFKKADLDFLEAKQKKSMDVYYDFFSMCYNVLKPGGKVVLHLGNSKVCNMADELEIRARDKFEVVYKGSENVETIEKHGIKDKGATFEHQYLFLEKK